MVIFKHTGECLEANCKRRRIMKSVSQSGTVVENTVCRVQKPLIVRHRQKNPKTELSDSGFEEDFPFLSPSPFQTCRRSAGPEVPLILYRLLSNWHYHYGEIGFKIQIDKEKQFHPFRCLARQPQVTAEARCKLVSWLIPVHRHFRLSFECSCLAVNIMDRFLASTPVAADCFQLLGVTTLLLASKQVEVFSPRISQLLSLCCNAFSREQLCNLECLILLRLNFRLAAPTLAFFLDHYSNNKLAAQQVGRDVDHNMLPEDNEELQKRQLQSDTARCISLARTVCELSLADYTFNKYPPSLTARCAVTLANELLKTEKDLADPINQSQMQKSMSSAAPSEVECNHCMSQNDQTSIEHNQPSVENEPTQSVGTSLSVEEPTPPETSLTLLAESHSCSAIYHSLVKADHTQSLAQECRENLKLLVSLNHEAMQAMITL